jgi:hypothetical protein
VGTVNPSTVGNSSANPKNRTKHTIKSGMIPPGHGEGLMYYCRITDLARTATVCAACVADCDTKNG